MKDLESTGVTKIYYTNDYNVLENMIDEIFKIGMKLKSIERLLSGKEDNVNEDDLSLIIANIIE